MNCKSIKEKFFTWGQNTTFHGVPHIFIAKNLSVKLFWIVCIFACSCGGVYFISKNVIVFFNYEVRTIFSIDSESDILFPTISICNLNTCNNHTEKCENSNETISNYLTECKFDGKNCTGEDFFEFYLDEYRKCSQFNGKHTSMAKSRTGKNYGLKLKLEIKATNCCELESIVLYVHNHPDWITNELTGYLINYDVETDVAIERILNTKKPNPKRDCVLNSNKKAHSIHISRTFTYLKVYNQKVCKYLCFQEFLKYNLDCYDSDLPNTYRNLSECWKLSNFNKIKSKIYTKKQNECLKNCPIECEIQKYTVTLSELKYPFYGYKKISDMKKGIENISNHSSRSVLLNIFYKSDTYTKIDEQDAVNFNKLLSNIGSNMGLFLGISFLSLFELINLLIEIIIVLINKIAKKKQITKSNT